MDIGALAQQGLELLRTTGAFLQDGTEIVKSIAVPAGALWGWFRKKFVKDESALEQLEELEHNPDSSESRAVLQYALKKHLADNPNAQKELAALIADLTEALQNAPAETRNYMQNNTSTYGPIIQNFSGGTFNYNVDTKKKPPKN